MGCFERIFEIRSFDFLNASTVMSKFSWLFKLNRSQKDSTLNLLGYTFHDSFELPIKNYCYAI